jgi:ribonuclease BN (tRNA processing enzyme)
MRLTFLGTGSAMPVADRHQTGLLLEPGDGSNAGVGSDADEGNGHGNGNAGGDTVPDALDRPLLVDCGAGVLHRLAATDPGYEGVSSVLLTHHHLDHVADLLPLVKARWLAGETHLEVVGPTGTKGLLDGLLDVHSYLEGRVELRVREVADGQSFSVAGADVEAFETRHSVRCLAYRFAGGGPTGEPGDGGPGASAGDDPSASVGEDPGTREEETPRAPSGGDLVYSGDSEAFRGLTGFADGASVLVHDCSFPDDVDVSNHPTPSQLGAALAGREIDRVYLTHLYPHTEGRHAEMLESVGEAYDGDVRFARDGLTIAV